MSLHIDEATPVLSAEQTLTGWRREFCVELLGDGQARIFLRAVPAASLKAAELRRGLLFHRVNHAFHDLPGCVAASRDVLERLAQTASRPEPTPDNLFATACFDRQTWDRVVYAVEQWQRRPPPTSCLPHAAAPMPRSDPALSRRPTRG
ncbi:MAG: hypothetical protein DI603_01695 [Roseateles depolymerans]|uniref:Uncharacterized protein n=1 Tax=Roseateles depolymerans TaxID=76731 RepID=A0A2W5E1E7_9BURK|nr:MAG: hypothetical protein DI603_01695 [Roseateles depolymerans]